VFLLNSRKFRNFSGKVWKVPERNKMIILLNKIPEISGKNPENSWIPPEKFFRQLI